MLKINAFILIFFISLSFILCSIPAVSSYQFQEDFTDLNDWYISDSSMSIVGDDLHIAYDEYDFAPYAVLDMDESLMPYIARIYFEVNDVHVDSALSFAFEYSNTSGISGHGIRMVFSEGNNLVVSPMSSIMIYDSDVTIQSVPYPYDYAEGKYYLVIYSEICTNDSIEYGSRLYRMDETSLSYESIFFYKSWWSNLDEWYPANYFRIDAEYFETSVAYDIDVTSLTINGESPAYFTITTNPITYIEISELYDTYNYEYTIGFSYEPDYIIFDTNSTLKYEYMTNTVYGTIESEGDYYVNVTASYHGVLFYHNYSLDVYYPDGFSLVHIVSVSSLSLNLWSEVHNATISANGINISFIEVNNATVSGQGILGLSGSDGMDISSIVWILIYFIPIMVFGLFLKTYGILFGNGIMAVVFGFTMEKAIILLIIGVLVTVIYALSMRGGDD